MLCSVLYLCFAPKEEQLPQIISSDNVSWSNIFYSRTAETAYWVSNLLLGYRNKLHVELGDLRNEQEALLLYLRSKTKVEIIPIENRLFINSENVPSQEIQRLVTKFIYHKNLNNLHWVSVEGKTIKVNNFKNVKKPEKSKHKKTTTAVSTPAQSWGL